MRSRGRMGGEQPLKQGSKLDLDDDRVGLLRHLLLVLMMCLRVVAVTVEGRGRMDCAIRPFTVRLRTGTAPLVWRGRAKTVVVQLLLRRCWVQKLLVLRHVVHIHVASSDRCSCCCCI